MVVNMKLWEAVDEQHSLRGPEDCTDAVVMYALNRKLLDLNAKRNALVREIDECLANSAKN
jgi:hypothetical protein